MDYRDLIDTLRHGDPLDIVVQAYEIADAIETLLKERDAVCLARFHAGYTVRQRRRKDGNKTVIYIECRK